MIDISKTTPQDVTATIVNNRAAIRVLSAAQYPDHIMIRSLEAEIAFFQETAMRRCTHEIIFGRMEDEQAIINWARASYGMEVMS